VVRILTQVKSDGTGVAEEGRIRISATALPPARVQCGGEVPIVGGAFFRDDVQ
jgi:hypothetical protein